jgi:sec-independent protein translocase protein TatC
MAAEHEENFKEMELWEHLAELRTRMIRSLLYVGVGMIVAWNLYPWLWKIIMAPADQAMKRIGGEWVYRHMTSAFMAQFQVSLVGGLIIALPLMTLELWGFIAPGLTRTERRGFYACVPLSLFFFAVGVACGYFSLPMAFGYFATFFMPGAAGGGFKLQQDPIQYLMFVMKMLLGFGLVFQLPVILMFLGYIGAVTSATLKAQWRIALVVCSVVAAVVTPSPDAMTMLMMTAPLCLLYLASIWMVAIVEKIRERRIYRPSYDTP